MEDNICVLEVNFWISGTYILNKWGDSWRWGKLGEDECWASSDSLKDMFKSNCLALKEGNLEIYIFESKQEFGKYLTGVDFDV